MTGDWPLRVRVRRAIEGLKTLQIGGSGRGVGVLIGGLYPYTVYLVSVYLYRGLDILDVSYLDLLDYFFFIVGEGWDSDVPDLGIGHKKRGPLGSSVGGLDWDISGRIV